MWTYFNYLPFQILLFQLEQPVRTEVKLLLFNGCSQKKNGNARLLLYNALNLANKMVPCKLNFFIFNRKNRTCSFLHVIS